ncbi:hypothetical protein Tco_1519196, partial [Tanacetum coccineum]
EPLISRKSQKKSYYAISFEESPSKKKSAKVKKVATAKPKPTKNKAPVKADISKGLNVLSEVALSEAAQLKEATKQSKKDFHISQAGGSGDGTDFESGVPDEQHLKTTGADEGTGTIPGVPDVPKYNSESEKESCGNNGEEDDNDGIDSEDENDNGNDDDDYDDNDDDDDDGDGDDDEANDDDNLKDDHTNNDDEETDSDRTESDRMKILIDDEEKMDKEEDDEINKELYKDVNVNLGNEDTNMTNADQGGSDQQNVSQESGFKQVEEDAYLLNLENPSLAENEIASMMETSARHATTVLEITSVFTSTIPPSPPVTNLEKDLSKIKQVDQYDQALSFIPAIVDCYIDNKLGEAINKAIQAHNLN